MWRIMSEFTTHFEDDAWLGFVRGLMPEEDVRGMLAHLNSGCEECRRTHEIWQRFLEIARQEAGDAAPESAIRFVKAAIALRRRVPFAPGLSHAAERIFDSFQEPLPMGFRGSPASPRRLLYKASSFLVDLRLEQNPGPSAALTGQVVSALADKTTGCAGVVLLQDSKTVVGQTITNSLGEFQFDFDHQGSLRICLEIPDGTLIDVALPGERKRSHDLGPSGESPAGPFAN